jgi:hypothetical protein
MKRLFESGILPLVFFVGTGLLWTTLVYQSTRVFHRFRAKYPEVAAKEIPYAFSWASHPEKAFYFFRKKARELLKQDPDLWRERQIFVFLTIASIVIPIAAFIPLFIYAVLHS